ncbi:hypothetical protein [Maritimibacter sp. DP1N21-5]|uniref:hypothetical protein n=1 Tax=Maritimibacter sp. DP1N21-5 TaxID=2836867 RepID=UPI001C45074F|nr:hypothetical protein [Maritimibacter sp. DP1N21-5]MBV7407536.1 hypothetical protein [Maritimibacter sp. DP1N21-5]
MTLSLDWNCVVEVEEGRSQSKDVLRLVEHHRAGTADVALLATSASENNRSKRFPGSAAVFKERIFALGWDDLPIVSTPGIFGLTYWDWSFYVGDGPKFKRDIAALWTVISPRVDRDLNSYLVEGTELTAEAIQGPELYKWRNAWCDVHSAYSHIHAQRSVFVTNNIRDFQANAADLGALGMRSIRTPRLACADLDAARS